ncbi:hypothetical protein MK852_07635 [Shewanella benthica]|uniref:hypothetical protein n=1 Tax=Shewanella benthica TaxID=43661 RepID=UPI001879962B|nr:hypothetical protein [Shewanella benthica]MBE7215004.1 hypothetical protein [Shewanella benthica]MCL1062002.1 hypothetical protein [Shewanella benthica]
MAIESADITLMRGLLHELAIIIKLSFTSIILLFAVLHKFLLVPNLASDNAQSHHE